MANNTGNSGTTELPEKMTVAEIRSVLGYKTEIGTYQMIRRYGVRQVSDRPQPGNRVGGPVGEYDTKEILHVFRDRLSRINRERHTENS